ncbi:hypothetical protein [Mucilaginibacter gilvus]|uniref:Uncharacterized protein n=1 Tax=Mucilaginibacter gilvus TaxID=2305909 RepID=A0A3S3VFB6_9SPHI|nr:hypothetical protein [Mucilaginibacter gilvus]RWY47089.1 hypothetical protein EPL05_22525 [Mucilaginibacter gilvus]
MTDYFWDVACGPGFPLIRLQALRFWPVPAAIPNAITAQHSHHVMLNLFQRPICLVATMQATYLSRGVPK